MKIKVGCCIRRHVEAAEIKPKRSWHAHPNSTAAGGWRLEAGRSTSKRALIVALPVTWLAIWSWTLNIFIFFFTELFLKTWTTWKGRMRKESGSCRARSHPCSSTCHQALRSSKNGVWVSARCIDSLCFISGQSLNVELALLIKSQVYCDAKKIKLKKKGQNKSYLLLL
jgi:hypothetical protein